MITNKNVAANLAKVPTTTNGNLLETGKASTTSPEQKTELPTITAEKKPPTVTTIEDRFYKMDVLFSLREKHEKIKESLEKLNKFKLSSDGRSDNITLKDGSSNSFSTYNPEVLVKVVDWLKEDLTKKLAEVEAQIIF